ncbi:LexA repressor [Pleomorphomonas sp. SM30]|uniref:Phage repressor protein C with HTH and peptisase S24 domain n=2 Tax=Oharaeibacter diazotrophicus TaxID=1920512 RepID=A0A4R6RG81_9HYPH|nr:phage repressor protein C with HTH and peptisase S24 domain [Oharaeibacter diazotrophicus]BBE74339.1 LexA repressor [Pleomorphomonas sp. SM30]
MSTHGCTMRLSHRLVNWNHALFAHDCIGSAVRQTHMHAKADPYLEWLNAGLSKPGKSQSGLARAMGVDPSVVNKISNGKRRLKSSEIPIAATYIGEPAPAPDELQYVPIDEDGAPSSPSSSIGMDGPRMVYTPEVSGASPEVDVRGGAGDGAIGNAAIFALPAGGSATGHEVIGEWLFPMPFLRQELKARPGYTVVVEVQGDSMRPTLEPGDRVIVDLSQNRLGPDGAVYLISDDDGEPQVKRIQKTDGEPRKVLVTSDNPAVRDRPMRADRVKIIGRVVGRFTRL